MLDNTKPGIERRARGVIPTKVSDLQNDLNFITKEDFENFILSSQEGSFTGLTNEGVEVIVDNLKRTIEAKLVKSFEESLSGLVPYSNGKYSDGTYLLKATVSNGEISFRFAESDSSLIKRYYYGSTTVEPEYISESIIKSLNNGGEGKGDREVTFSSYKQRQIFAYPAEYGQLKRIDHIQSGMEVTSLFERYTVDVGGVAYLVYVSHSVSTGEYTYKFSY